MKAATISHSHGNSRVSMNGKLPSITTPIPGPRSREIFADEQRYVAPGRQRISLLAGVAFDHGEGATLTDADDNVYLDFYAGVAVASLGHGHPALSRALAHQASLRLARSATKKHEIVGFWGGFHGKTGGVIGLIGDESKQGYGPLPGGRYQVPYADCYRCPFKLEYPSCGLSCVDFAREQIKNSSAGDIAAIIVEPIQGTAGNVIPPDDWMPAIKSVAKDEGALLIADEMITGFGRTGKMWGVEHSGVTPDIVTVGKGMGSGFPVSGVLMSDELGRAEPFSKPSASSSSYGGNPLAAVAVSETIKAIRDERLVENSRKVGAILLARLNALKEKYEFVGDVRGKGLLIGIDLVRNLKTKALMSRRVTEVIFREALKRGLLLMGYFPRVRINPPLVITEAQAEAGAGILDEVFAYLRDHVDWRVAE